MMERMSTLGSGFHLQRKATVDNPVSTERSSGQGHKQIDSKHIKLGKVVGRGAEGVVRIATWEGLTVAVKVISLPLAGHDQDDDADEEEDDDYDDVSGSSAIWREALQEAKMLVRLRHPNIVQVCIHIEHIYHKCASIDS